MSEKSPDTQMAALVAHLRAEREKYETAAVFTTVRMKALEAEVVALKARLAAVTPDAAEGPGA